MERPQCSITGYDGTCMCRSPYDAGEYDFCMCACHEPERQAAREAALREAREYAKFWRNVQIFRDAENTREEK